MSDKQVYLAGPITGLGFDDAVTWREWVIERLDGAAVCKSPMRLKDHLKTVDNFDPRGEAGNRLSTAHAIFARDAWDVRESNIMLAYLGGSTVASVGTCVEYGIAHATGTYIITVMPDNEVIPHDTGGSQTRSTNPHDHAFIHQASALVVPTLDEACRIIEAL